MSSIQGIRRSPRLAEKRERTVEKVSQITVQNPVKENKKEPIDLDILTKESLAFLRCRAAYMGLLYKNMLTDYKKSVNLICWAIDMLLQKTDDFSITYREYLYISLKKAVDGYLFYHPDDIASVKKNYKNDFHTYVAHAKDLLNPLSINKYKANIDYYIDVMYHFIEDPILISQVPQLRHAVMGRLKHLEDYIVRKGLESDIPTKIIIMKAHVTLALLPLRDDFRV